MERWIAIGAVAVGGCVIPFRELPEPEDSSSGTGAGGVGGASTSSNASSGRGGSGGGSGPMATGGGQGGAGGSCCDCDGDNQESISCGGADCADHDPRAFAGQAQSFNMPIVGLPQDVKPYDFNCDGEETLEFVDVVNCEPSVQCDDTPKWTDDEVPNCGETGDISSCGSPGRGLCAVQFLGNRKQACK